MLCAGRIIAGLIAFGWFSAACSAPAPGAPTSTPTHGVTLTPYLSRTPAATRTPEPLRVSSPTPLPTPTATPYLYSIVEGDTLIGIAFRFGLTLADLLAANPGIDPQFLTIGDELIIPVLENAAAGAAGAAAAAVPTPVGFVMPAGEVDCYPSADEGLWCFQLFENTGDQAVEGLSARFTVYDADGEILGEWIGLPPVNLLLPGESLPLAAWFPDLGETFAFAGSLVLSAIPVRPDDPRYVVIEVEVESTLTGAAAAVSGTLIAPDGASVAAFRLGLIAYDMDGRVVGVRVLQIAGPGPAAFDDVVYSLAGDIDRVQVVVEAVLE